MSNDQSSVHRVSLVEERIVVDKQVEEGDRVRVHTHVRTHDILVAADLRSDEVTVERIVINREVQDAPQVRQEGDVVIVPIVEEEVVVTKRLILKEELRIRRQELTRHVEETVPVRRVEGIIARGQPVEDQPGPKET